MGTGKWNECKSRMGKQYLVQEGLEGKGKRKGRRRRKWEEEIWKGRKDSQRSRDGFWKDWSWETVRKMESMDTDDFDSMMKRARTRRDIGGWRKKMKKKK